MMPGNDPMTKKSRELYIGNLPDGVPEAQLMSFLNAALLQVSKSHASDCRNHCSDNVVEMAGHCFVSRSLQHSSHCQTDTPATPPHRQQLHFP